MFVDEFHWISVLTKQVTNIIQLIRENPSSTMCYDLYQAPLLTDWYSTIEMSVLSEFELSMYPTLSVPSTLLVS